MRSADGSTTWLDEPSDPPLGVASTFRRRSVGVGPGSTLVFYTDGLVERRTESIVVGMERLRRACESGPGAADELCKHLSAVMLADGFATDDVAIVVVTVT